MHLHWRLKRPASTEAEHELLRELRELATNLVGGDGTNISIVHPIRWPGSWHRKSTPRLAEIVAFSDNEIDLTEALERLRDAVGAATFTGLGLKTAGNKLGADDHAAVASALAVIPNGTNPKAHDWDYWNQIGMKAWASTGGSEAGRVAFHAWSSKSPKIRQAGSRRPLGSLQDISADKSGLRLAGLSGLQALARMVLRPEAESRR